jgi:SAM-dependent methyltransferase
VRLTTRTPEPELMESPEQARAYAAADFSVPHEAFVECFRERFPEFAGGRVVDLGCGTADVTVRFALALPASAVHGVDGSTAMLELGAEHVRASGLGGRITLQRAHLPVDDAVGELAGPYDATISNSLLHHLDDPMVLWHTVTALTRVGAPVLVMDLRRPSDTDEVEWLVATYAAGEHPVLQADFRASLLAAYTVDEVGEQVDAAGVPFTVETSGDRHLLVCGSAPRPRTGLGPSPDAAVPAERDSR